MSWKMFRTLAIAAIVPAVVFGIWLLRVPPACPTYTMTDLLHMADPIPECK
jgi:hypothetical protein